MTPHPEKPPAAAPQTGAPSAAAPSDAAPQTGAPLLELIGLTVRYPGGPPVLRDLDLTIDAGEMVGVTGPSGIGKTTLGLATIGLAAWSGAEVSGITRWRGQPCHPRGLARLRGDQIGYLPQEARPALNPYRTCGSQILEGLRTARGGPRPPVDGPRTPVERDRLDALLSVVGLDSGVARQFPHRLSGGMCQRVLLAAALAGGPALLVVDEPTASLDTLNRRRVLSLLTRLRRDTGVAVLLITHDNRAVAEICDRHVDLAAPAPLIETAATMPPAATARVSDARR